MKEFIRSQWAKSMRSIAAAEASLETDPDSAASRAYYAVFHGVTAVLAGRGMEFTKHTAVRAALHRDLIQSGALSADLGRDYDQGVAAGTPRFAPRHRPARHRTSGGAPKSSCPKCTNDGTLV